MRVSAQGVASELRQRLPGLQKTQLQKLLYYAQGHYLAMYGTRLFSDEIMAYDHGPVVQSVWARETYGVPEPHGMPKFTEKQLNAIGYVISRYGGLSSADLERLTHSEAPWIEADVNRVPGESAPMPIESIKRFFVAAREDERAELGFDPFAVDAVTAGATERLGHPASVDSLDDLRRRRRELLG